MAAKLIKLLDQLEQAIPDIRDQLGGGDAGDDSDPMAEGSPDEEAAESPDEEAAEGDMPPDAGMPMDLETPPPFPLKKKPLPPPF